MPDNERKNNDGAGELLERVSAQLRLSLGNIYSALERLVPAEKRDGDSKVDMNAAVLCQSYYRILRLTNNLAEAGRLQAPVSASAKLRNDDIVGLCREVLDRAAAPAALLGLEVSFVCGKSSHIISMDPDRIELLLLNLLSNAFKYTPRGGHVALEVRAGKQWVDLILSDTGCGIPKEVREDVFACYLHPPLLDGKPHGLGLGLPICQRIVREHGGRMLLTDGEGGQGTRVLVSLPNRRTRGQQLHALVVPSGGFNRTLVELSDALPKEAFTQKYLD